MLSKLIIVAPDTSRDSNFELLRIVAMFMIVCHHIVVHGLELYSGHGLNAIDGKESTLVINEFINSFCIIGVNLFILISGYYSIKLNLKKVLSLALLISLYKIVRIAMIYIGTRTLSIEEILSPLFPISYHCGWFVVEYFILMFISPLLNTFVDKSFDANIKRQLIIFIYMLCFWGFARNMVPFSGGYSIWNFMLLYLIGRCIKVYDVSFTKESRNKYLLSYAVISILSASLQLLEYFSGKIYFNFMGYNSPLVIYSSISLFAFFKTLTIQNRRINYISASMLSVWLMQEGAGLGSSYGYKIIGRGFLDFHWYGFAMIIIIYVVGLFACAIIVDKLFKWLISWKIEMITNNARKVYVFIYIRLFSK